MTTYNFQENLDYKYTKEFFCELIKQFYPSQNSNKILSALELAKNAHGNQTRSDGSLYIIHPLRVAILLLEMEKNLTSDLIIAALLHDVLEDTKLDEQYIQQIFNSDVLRMLRSVTRYRSPYETPDERKVGKMKKWKTTMDSDLSIRLIKTYDYLDNIMSWKFIKQNQPHIKKIPRWLMEAQQMYLPLAKITSEKAFLRMQQEIDYYYQMGFAVGDWYSDGIISERLVKKGVFYVDEKFDKNSVGSSEIIIKGVKYFRFMDFFYLPKPVIELSQSEVVAICDLRQDYAEHVIDLGLNSKIINCAVSIIKELSKEPVEILDFGCGSGLSISMLSEQIPFATFNGVDISEKAVQTAKKRGFNVLLLNDSNLPFKDENFDVVVAIFVLHFSISDHYFKEIFRVLKKTGIFIFNTYNQNKNILLSKISKYGFECKELDCKELPDNHYVIIGYKPIT